MLRKRSLSSVYCYLNVSGSYGGGGGAQADKPNKGMEGESKSSWAVEGYKYDKDRQQTLNATVGEGQIVVRNDKVTGQDSTVDLNRDVNKAYEITKDDEHRTDLYASSTSIDAVMHPKATLDRWKNSVTNFTKNQKVQATQIYSAIVNNWNDIQSQHIDPEDIPKNISEKFGDERALTITKNIVRAGDDPESLESLDPTILKALVDFADKAAVFDGSLSSCIENKTCSTNSPDGWKPGMQYEIGVTVTDNLPRNAGEGMLNPLIKALELAGQLPQEQIQAIGLSIQAIMGPFKLVVSLAAQAALEEKFGPQYQKIKEEAAIKLAAALTDRDPKTLREFNEEDKKDVHSVLKGDPYVKAAEFLIDSALGEIRNLGIRQAGRILAVNANGVTPPKVSASALQLTYNKTTRTWTTPAGLDYGRGTKQGNRIKHVLEHAEPNPNKTTHTVFSMDRKDILGVVDEAWLKKGSPVVGDPGAYVVPMGRVVVTAGETNIRIIVRPGTNAVLSAYPVP